jgi:transcriptional regulator with XRE-family HTH domain
MGSPGARHDAIVEVVRRHTRDSVDHPVLQVADLMRAARWWAKLSQRDVALRAGLPRVTVARIESGETADPAISTVQRIFAAAGFYLIVTNDELGELTPYHPDSAKYDRGGRYLPAHLKVHDVGEPYGTETERWWGWLRLAWERSDPTVPRWTFTRNRRANQLPVDFEPAEDG